MLSVIFVLIKPLSKALCPAERGRGHPKRPRLSEQNGFTVGIGLNTSLLICIDISLNKGQEDLRHACENKLLSV